MNRLTSAGTLAPVAIARSGRTLGRALVLAVMLAGTAHAQAPELRPGAVVRLRSASLPTLHYGEVTAVRPDSLAVALDLGGPPLPIALRDISWLEVSRGRPGMRTAGLWTGGILAALGGAYGLMVFQECQGDVCSGIPVDHAGQRALAAAGVSAAFGAIGFLVGALAVPERWSVLIDRATLR